MTIGAFSETVEAKRNKKKYDGDQESLWKVMHSLSGASYAKEARDSWLYSVNMNLARTRARNYCGRIVMNFVKMTEREFEDGHYNPKGARDFMNEFEIFLQE